MSGKILLLGSKGQLGLECQRSLSLLGNIVSLDYPEVNFTKPEALYKSITQLSPCLIVNCAAYTAVDQAETDKQRCKLVNAVSPGILAEAAASQNAALIHISTDYVFDGSTSAPYTEDENTNPLGYYGETKLAGEIAVQQIGGAYMIFRTAWLYSLWNENFVVKVLKWARSLKKIRVVADQVGSPTPAFLLAQTISLIASRSLPNPFEYFVNHAGVYHVASSGSTSRYDWAKAIVDLDPYPHEQILETIAPAKSHEFPTPAKRPAFSPLDCTKIQKTFGIQLPMWRDGLAFTLQPTARYQI